MKICFHSSAPFGSSSYAVLTARTVPNFVRDGHEVLLSTWYGLQGAPLPWGIMKSEEDKTVVGQVMIMPSIDGENYGSAIIKPNYDAFKADVLITGCDVWVFDQRFTDGTRFCPWFPVDHDPAPPNVLDALQSAIYPMVFSKWGVQVLDAAGVKAHYVPASAPTKTFKPMDMKAARAKLGIKPGVDFLVMMCAANKDPQDRKSFNEALQAFAKFAQTHPNAMLYIHTFWDGPINIGQIVHLLGIEDQVIRPDTYKYLTGLIKPEHLATAYSASNLLLNPAKSEGFGLPMVEAQMCGCPIAATDYSTTDELLFAGWKLPCVPDWTAGAETFRARPTIDGIVAALA